MADLIQFHVIQHEEETGDQIVDILINLDNVRYITHWIDKDGLHSSRVCFIPTHRDDQVIYMYTGEGAYQLWLAWEAMNAEIPLQ